MLMGAVFFCLLDNVTYKCIFISILTHCCPNDFECYAKISSWINLKFSKAFGPWLRTKEGQWHSWCGHRSSSSSQLVL